MKARLAQLWRSMPVRLALLLVLLFSTVSLLSLAASYAVTQNSFEAAIRADLEQDIAGFRAAPNAGAVALLVDAESRDTDPSRIVLSYISPNGRLFGNGAIARDDEGYHIVSLTQDRAEYDGAYLALTIPLYGGQLTVARSRAQIEALGTVFLNILLISLLPTVLIALSGGLYLARRSKRHVEVIGHTLDDLTDGDLAARVSVSPNWADDMIRIGNKVNQMAGAQEAQMQMRYRPKTNRIRPCGTSAFAENASCGVPHTYTLDAFLLRPQNFLNAQSGHAADDRVTDLKRPRRGNAPTLPGRDSLVRIPQVRRHFREGRPIIKNAHHAECMHFAHTICQRHFSDAQC